MLIRYIKLSKNKKIMKAKDILYSKKEALEAHKKCCP